MISAKDCGPGIFLNSSGNKGRGGIVSTIKSRAAFLDPHSRERFVMTVSPRLAFGISAAAFALGLALNLAFASEASASDPMSQDIDFRNSAAGQGGIRRDTPVREIVRRDTRKRDDGLKSYGSSK
jgi:hypothetical protein